VKVAITDACIFIDISDLKLISLFFDLDFDIHTSLDVYNELYPKQQEELSHFKNAGKLTIHNNRRR
jgi:hypothetical protein